MHVELLRSVLIFENRIYMNAVHAHATDETSMKRKQNHEALERTYSNRKPSPSPSHKPKIHEDNPGKADRIQ